MNVLLFDDDKVSLQKLEQKIVKYNCTILHISQSMNLLTQM